MQAKSLLLAALFFSYAASAQKSPSKNDSTKKGWTKDLLKVNLTSLPLKNVSGQYEYVLSKKMSLAMGLRVMPMTAVPMENVLINAFADADENTKNVIRISRISNVAVTPEVRFYLGKGYGQGFYIAPYYRFASFSSNTLIVHGVTLSGDMTAHTAGAMAGAQWFLGKHFVLDWWIAGAHYGTASGKFIGIPSEPLSNGRQEEIRNTLSRIDVPFTREDITVTANDVTVKTNGAFGGIRAGILFGIRL